ncbi:MAG TPA: VOC family protein [Acetobacteraceae bacterium]|nr:VOC family protein [Acetobacteraceae bacterium]
MPSKPVIIPALRYRDAPAAIDFLCTAFGFTRQAVYTDPSDPAVVMHAQLTLGDSMLMLGSVRPKDGASVIAWKTPAEAGGVTMSLNVVLVDLDAHYARAVAGGAEIVTPPHDNVGYPGRAYHARDPEGNEWNFDTYDPWAK